MEFGIDTLPEPLTSSFASGGSNVSVRHFFVNLRFVLARNFRLKIPPERQAADPLRGNPSGLPSQRIRRLPEYSPSGLSSNTRLEQCSSTCAKRLTLQITVLKDVIEKKL